MLILRRILRTQVRRAHAGVASAARAVAQVDLERARSNGAAVAGVETEPLPWSLSQPSVLSAAVANTRNVNTATPHEEGGGLPSLPSSFYSDLVASGRLEEELSRMAYVILWKLVAF